MNERIGWNGKTEDGIDLFAPGFEASRHEPIAKPIHYLHSPHEFAFEWIYGEAIIPEVF